MKIELRFPKHLFRLRYLVPLIAGLVVVYWLVAVRPYLQIDRARIAAPYLEIRTDHAGRLAYAPYEDGAIVKQGDTLFSLNSEEEKAQQKQMQATVESLRKMISFHLESVEQAMQEYLGARSDVERGAGTIDSVEQPLRVLQEQQTEANDCQQQLATAQANLDYATQQLHQKSTPAPFSGVIVKQQKKEGDVVQFGDIVYSFCDPNRLWVEATVPETAIARVSVGQTATIRLPSSSDKKWQGSVVWISPVALPSGEGVPIRIALDKSENTHLRPNLSAEVKIKIH